MKYPFRSKLFLLLAALALFHTSCFRGLINIFKDPCDSHDLLAELSSLNQEQLKAYFNDLSQISFRDDRKSGCQKALLGRIAQAQGNMSAGSRYFADAAKKIPDLAPYFKLAQAKLDFAQKDFAEAQKLAKDILAQKSPQITTTLSKEARLLLAHIAQEHKDDLQIVQTHDALMNEGFLEDQIILFNLGNALSRLKEHHRAEEIYRALLIQFPASAEAKTTSIRKLASMDLSLQEWERRFKRLEEALDYHQIIDDAHRFSRRAPKTLTPRSIKLQAESVKAHLYAHRFEAGIELAQKLTQMENPPFEWFFVHAWALSKVDRFIEAAEIYRKANLVAKKDEEQAKACFFSGFSHYEGSFYATAQLTWLGCEKKLLASSMAENYLWYQALSSLLQNHFTQAKGYLVKLVKSSPKSSELPKYQFFLGETLRANGENAASRAIFQNLVNKNAIGYYGLLARSRLLLKPIEGAAIPKNAFHKKAFAENQKWAEEARLLYALGFEKEARELLLKRGIKEKNLLPIMQSLQGYHEVYKRAPSLEPKPHLVGHKLNPSVNWRALFPVPWDKSLNKSCKNFGVDKNLVLSIMQSESGFLPTAKSSRGARGLMQIMPQVATQMAQSLKVESFAPHMLNDPELSIYLGTAMLGKLKKQFDKPLQMVAAYNAGPHHVRRWIKRFGALPDLLFIERVPYEQTRSYVKKVLTSVALRSALEGKPLSIGI